METPRKPPSRVIAGASLPLPPASSATESRYGTAVRVPSKSTFLTKQSSVKTTLKGGSPTTRLNRLSSRSPMNSSGSSGSQSSTKLYRSVASVARSTTSSSTKSNGGKSSFVPRVNATSTKKRRLSAYNGQPKETRVKQTQRVDVHSEKDDVGEESSSSRQQSPSPQRQESMDQRTSSEALSSVPRRQPPNRQKQLTLRMAEHLFRHSTALLHHGNLDNDVRTDDLMDEVRHQREKQEKYERKIRSLRRELATLDPTAAAAYARGESIALNPETWLRTLSTPQPPPPSSQSVDKDEQPVDMLIPAHVPTREAAIRAADTEWNTKLSAFPDALRGLDEFAQAHDLTKSSPGENSY